MILIIQCNKPMPLHVKFLVTVIDGKNSFIFLSSGIQMISKISHHSSCYT